MNLQFILSFKLYIYLFLDEMYAAIDEQDKVYTSGSETYAQIQPMTTEASRSVATEQSCTQTSQEHTSAPQPPSVDSLRHVAHAHSRQGYFYFIFYFNINKFYFIIYLVKLLNFFNLKWFYFR